MNYFIDTVKTDQFEMDYLKFGNGKDAFVILPGLSVKSVLGSAATIVRQYEKIAENYTVYLFDRRKQLPDKYSIRAMADDTVTAMDFLGLKKANIFGASQGGMIAMCIALKYPEYVGKLILGSTSSCVTDEHFKILENWASAADKGNKEALYLDFGKMIYPADFFAKYEGALKMFAKTITDDELDRFAFLARCTKGFNMTDKLSLINCPVLLLSSKDDNVLGYEASQLICDKLKEKDGFSYHVYEGFGHAAYDTAPDYVDRLLSFLEQS